MKNKKHRYQLNTIMETKTNPNLKFKVPYDINDTELSNRFKANNENLIEKIKILI